MKHLVDDSNVTTLSPVHSSIYVSVLKKFIKCTSTKNKNTDAIDLQMIKFVLTAPEY